MREEASDLSLTLVPIWADREACQTVLPEVERQVKAMGDPLPTACGIYVATLRLAAGNTRPLPESRLQLPADSPWRKLIAAQRACEQAEYVAGIQILESLGANRESSFLEPFVLYWTGRCQLADESTREAGLLSLLQIPASHGDSFPEVAAAALYEVDRHLRRNASHRHESQVRQELLESYGQTSFARRLQTNGKNESCR